MHANYTEQERNSKIKKAYSTLSNAMTRVKADGGDMIFDVVNNDNENMKSWFDTYLKQYLITTKICYDEKGCWNDGNTKQLNGSVDVYCNRTGVGIGSNIITAVLNDGTFINIDSYSQGSIQSHFGVNIETDDGLVVFFDINGSKKPNTMGRDVFVTVFTEDGLVPAFKDKTREQSEIDCSASGTGYSCLRQYLGK